MSFTRLIKNVGILFLFVANHDTCLISRSYVFFRSLKSCINHASFLYIFPSIFEKERELLSLITCYKPELIVLLFYGSRL
uniref:Uncharacterized protein n=1 Tax=Rhizophora mucronata TaxID=61149 RepID=A0A2P2QUX3_RHIMU